MLVRYLLVISVLFLVGCVYDTVQVFTVKNNTDSILYVCYSLSDSLPSRPAIYMFDTFKLNGKDTIVPSSHKLNPHSEGNVTEFQNKSMFDSGVYLFYIKEEVMKTKGWDDIAKYQLYAKRVYHSYDSLIKNNFQVQFSE